MIRQNIVVCIMTCLFLNVSGQSFGIRAGLNYTKISGDLEQGVNEKYNIANGFHFGINYAYKFADVFAVKTEILYTQVGSNYKYDGESFYKIPLSGGNAFVYEKGKSTINMKVSNAYISMPITFQWQASKKFEFNIGVYGSYMIGPKGNGTIIFKSFDHPDSLKFQQSLIHNYNSDIAGGIASNTKGPSIFVDGMVVTLARDAGAYYNYLPTEKVGSLYKPYDYGLTGAVSFYINKGFYIGLRYDFGLVDITNNNVDAERKTFDEVNTKTKFSSDFDRNVGIQASFGFRF
ncbi:MAG: PorT family protein [Saprospiraceae bacterium]|nr:PorT family protein [Saprospiraceae bacterium]